MAAATDKPIVKDDVKSSSDNKNKVAETKSKETYVSASRKDKSEQRSSFVQMVSKFMSKEKDTSKLGHAAEKTPSSSADSKDQSQKLASVSGVGVKKTPNVDAGGDDIEDSSVITESKEDPSAVSESQEDSAETQEEPVENQEKSVENQEEPLESQEESVESQEEPVEKQEEPAENQEEPVENQEEPAETQEETIAKLLAEKDALQQKLNNYIKREEQAKLFSELKVPRKEEAKITRDELMAKDLAISAHKLRVDILEGKNKDLEERCLTLTKTNATLSAQSKETNEKVAKLSKDLDLKVAECNELTEKVTKLSKDLDSKVAECSELTEKSYTLSKNLDFKSIAYNLLNNNVSELSKILESRDAECKELAENRSALSKDLDLRVAECNKLTEKVSELSKALEETQKNVTVLESNEKDMKSQVLKNMETLEKQGLAVSKPNSQHNSHSNDKKQAYSAENSAFQPCLSPVVELPVRKFSSPRTASDFFAQDLPTLYGILVKMLTNTQRGDKYRLRVSIHGFNFQFDTSQGFQEFFRDMDSMPRKFPLLVNQCRTLLLILQLNFIANSPGMKNQDLYCFDLYLKELAHLTCVEDEEELKKLYTGELCSTLITGFCKQLRYDKLLSPTDNLFLVNVAIKNYILKQSEPHMNMINLFNKANDINDSYMISKQLCDVIRDIREFNNMDMERLKKNEDYVKKNLNGTGSRIAKKLITDSLQIINNMELMLLATSTFHILKRNDQTNVATRLDRLNYELRVYTVNPELRYSLTNLERVHSTISSILKRNDVTRWPFS